MKCPDGFSAVEFGDTTIYVSNDYYKQDGIRMPLTLDEAYRVVDDNDCILPTPAIVDAIWSAADIKLPPKPLKPGPEMTTLAYFKKHDAEIERQLSEYDITDKLIAGHKKDIILINRTSPRVAIYGWHRVNGRPIQPRSTVHGENYKDYSHGLRLIKRTAMRFGEEIVING